MCGVFSLLRIPFIVIVQPHLLRDKGSLRLRSVISDSGGKAFNFGGNDEFVQADLIATTIKKKT